VRSNVGRRVSAPSNDERHKRNGYPMIAGITA
jgi:hypothetical protein